MLIISQQTDSPKDVFVDSNSYGPILGQNRNNTRTKSTKLAQVMGAKISTPKQDFIADNLHFQLPFLRVITETESFVHISVGNNISQLQIKKVISQIKKHAHDHNIVLLTNIELTTTPTKKADEQKQIAKVMEQASPKDPLIHIFQQLVHFQKKKPEIIAYVNPGDFGVKSSIATRYVCAVG